MSERKDILIDESNDLMIKNGDFVIGRSDVQHVDHLIMAFPGEYKEHAEIGLGAIAYIKSNTSKIKFKRDLRIQLNYDGYQKPVIDLTEGFKNLKVEV